ncbi:MAG: D-alanine--D-alanine ligase family protein [Actinomycetota bacterium]
MQVAFTYNVRHLGAGVDAVAQSEAEFDEPGTVAAIHDAIEANGHACVDVEADEDAFETLRSLRGSIDLVFNIAEGRRGDTREAQVPAMLEMLGIPFSHSGSLTQAISLDKALTKKVWRYHGLPTPRFVLFGPGLEQEAVEAVRFPVLVKPNAEGSSKGLFNDNLVEDPARLPGKVEEIRDLVGGKVLVEEFLGGREFTVTVLGNPGIEDGLMVLPIVEQTYELFPPDLRPFASYEAKWFFDGTDAGRAACVCPADLAPGLREEVEDLACRAFVALGCRDVARVDIRLDDEGRASLLEINPLPGMYHDPEQISYFPVSARAAGWDYSRMIGEVLSRTIARVHHDGHPAPVDRVRAAPAT